MTSQRLCRLLVVFGILFNATIASAEDAVRVVKDLSYKGADVSEYESERCKLDLYLPKQSKGFATIVWFHGGSIQSGDKAGDIALSMANRFASEGIAVASVNYRLHPKVKFPAYIEDCAASVAFVKKQISKYGGSSDKIFVSGHSAGGYLTSMVGGDPQFLAKYGLGLKDIAGLMPVAGQMVTHSTVRIEKGMPKEQPFLDAAAPSYHVNKSLPPSLNIVGSNDLPARAAENLYFVEVMKSVKHEDVTYLEVEGRNHGTIASMMGEADDEVALAIKAFIKRLSNE